MDQTPHPNKAAVRLSALQVFQATYGERDRGHGLLCSSDGDFPSAEITALTDRLESSPATLRWLPYVRGFVWKSWYVLARTFPDAVASRAGMVFTHALFVRLQDFVLTHQMDTLATLLMPEVARGSVLRILELPISDERSSGVPEPPASNTTRLASALLGAKGLPVVWLGQDGFEEAIFDLWARLWPTTRGALQFGVAFSPQDLEGQKLTVVASLRPLTSRWSGYQIVDLAQPIEPAEAEGAFSSALAYILQCPRQEILAQLFTDLESPPAGFNDVMLAARVAHLLPALAGPDSASLDAEALRAIGRVVGKLSPDPRRGVNLKGRLMDRLAFLTAAGSDEDVVALRNFDLTPFSGAVDTVGEAIEKWFEQSASAQSSFGTHSGEIRRDAGRVLLLADGEGAWTTMVRTAVASVFGRWSSELALRVWDWLRTDSSIAERIAPQLPAAVGSSLAETCPASLPQAIASAIVEMIALPMAWDALGAACFCAAYLPSEAYESLRRFPTLATPEGYATIAKRVPAIDTIQEAIATGDVLLCELAGKLCADDPTLLVGLDPRNPVWLIVWDRAARITHDVWRGIIDPRSKLDSVLEALLKGVSVPETLLQDIAGSEHSSLCENTRRMEILDAVPEVTRNRFASATADDWLRHHLSGIPIPPFDALLEAYLRAAIAERERVQRFLRKPEHPALVWIVSLFRTIPELDESLLQAYLRDLDPFAQSVSPEAAQALGHLIVDRGWNGAATDVVEKASQSPRSMLRSTIQITAHLLPLWRRILLWRWIPGESLVEDDPWAALLELATELYPWGPGEQELWKRAGGDRSRIPNRATGWESWHAAIALIRDGGGGRSLSGHRLLMAMQEDFPLNNKVACLRDLPVFKS